MAHAHDHDFFVPKNNIWPPLTCLGVALLAFAFITWRHFSDLGAQILLVAGVLVLGFSMVQLFRTIIDEARQRGDNVPAVLDLGTRYGMIFFIASEVMFFSAFFAAYFYLSLFNPAWPPANIEVLPLDLPVINTLLLLTSGATITFAHHALLENNRSKATFYTFLTWQLGVLFLMAQAYEYAHAPFSISDGVYGTLFFMLTGFHGMHVLVGTIMLMVAHNRLAKGDFTPKNHFYYEATAWYWHFVDVVWVGLFIFVYLM
jgi:cytochrome c oxidase subunit 3|tara:strand:- start:33 stop:809 length:777 start_codon:yes stop_codon:yes gene_type:complete